MTNVCIYTGKYISNAVKLHILTKISKSEVLETKKWRTEKKKCLQIKFYVTQ